MIYFYFYYLYKSFNIDKQTVKNMMKHILGHTSMAFTLNTYVHKTSEFEKFNVEKAERNIKIGAQIGAQT
ncbi:hypothetical protein ACQRBF_07570 [Peptoniphilaceae bacterium SGI.131]